MGSVRGIAVTVGVILLGAAAKCEAHSRDDLATLANRAPMMYADSIVVV